MVQSLSFVETSIEHNNGFTFWLHNISESDRANLLRFDATIVSPLEFKQVNFA